MSPQFAHDPGHSWLGAPIDARPLFVVEHAALRAVLRGLEPADGGEEAVPGWTVHDLAAHLLGAFYGRLARDRDGHQEGPRFAPGETLETFIHRINQEWVDALARVSPAALTDTLELVGGQVARFFETAAPGARSLGVSWAGIDPAPMWLDCARDLTEFWTHRQQIRHAVGQETDLDPQLPHRRRPATGRSRLPDRVHRLLRSAACPASASVGRRSYSHSRIAASATVP
ncbi:maleylpyruvate isomerase family mycothiol-dependent enzyme [Streptomyces sp. NRRL S-1813]|uniref:maleylpyruvate isomerase family mycothiol-dependent enzyme n=1 Tax=Streptomyces sp. NRRL S-1813 TaxID=1463888 RepID=UPI00099B4FE1|nr:maleylpyruvate isomerase family mycothiol-dependent enzyme [Streptomyces sp. NRRL S-1813]